MHCLNDNLSLNLTTHHEGRWKSVATLDIEPRLLGRTAHKLVTIYRLDRVQLKCDGTPRRTGGEVKGKLANGVGNQYPSHYLGTWCI